MINVRNILDVENSVIMLLVMKLILMRNKMFAWDGGQGPWGKAKPMAKPKVSRSEPRPYAARPAGNSPQPELEDVVNQMAERLRGFWRSGGNGSNGKGPGGLSYEWWGVAVFLLYLISGIYIVAPEEQGVVTRFGAYVNTSESGLNYHLPWPIESVVKLPVTRVNQLEVGFRSAENGGEPVDMPAESMMLSGDQNIVDLDFTVNWKIANPSAFIFNVADAQGTLVDVAESVMREVIGRHPVDDVLTSSKVAMSSETQVGSPEALNSKATVQFEARKRMQEVLDSYKLGIVIVNVSLQRVNPPMEVIEAFRDVQAANADKQRLINEANGYAYQILPLARGEAAKLLEQAQGYKEAKVAEATGAAERFNAQVGAYQQAPQVTRDRLYLETMENIMKDTPKVVTTSRNANGVLPFLPLDKMMVPAKPAAASEGEAR